MIYHEYLLIDAEDGYVFHFETGKLRTATNKPIDLNLMYTCRDVAAEMRGLALKTHTITFKTLYSDDLSFLAHQFHHFLSIASLDHGFERMLTRVMPMIGPSMAQRINNHFGQDIMERFTRLYCGPRGGRPAQNNPYRDDALAFNYDALRQTLKLAVTDPIIHQHLRQPTIYDEALSLEEILDLERGLDRWWIPTHEQLETLTRQNSYYWYCAAAAFEEPGDQILGLTSQRALKEGLFVRRFSTTAAAVHFFKSIPSTTRSQARSIIVHEDHASISGSTDILGLVPFCVENPCLRIQQRVDIWSAMMSAPNELGPYSAHWEFDDLPDWDGQVLAFQENFPNMLSSHLAIFENDAVPEAISTVFVSETQPEWTRAMVQRSLAEITAWVTSADPSKSNEDAYMRYNGRYICRSWLPVVEAVVNNEKAGQVRFDFEFDPSLARVWSDPGMASELAGIITNRLLREDNAFDSLDEATEQWWEQGNVQVAIPRLVVSSRAALYLDRTVLRPWDRPPTTMDEIVRAPGGAPDGLAGPPVLPLQGSY